MKIKVLNYNREAREFEIPDVFDHVHVRVLSGDEVVSVYDAYGNIIAGPFDPEKDNRMVDYHDGVYTVTPEYVEEWNKRTSSYDMDLGPDYELMNGMDEMWYGLRKCLDDLKNEL